MKTFLWRFKHFGFKKTLDIMVIGFAKRFVGAKKIHLTYK